MTSEDPSTPGRPSTSRALLLLSAANLALALVNASPLLVGKGLSTWMQSAFALVSMTGWLGLFFLLTGGALALASRSPSRSSSRPLGVAAGWIAPVLFTLLQVALFLDVKIYAMFRFHFNGVVWHTITAPGGWDSLHIPIADLVALFLAGLLFIAAQRWLFRFFERRGTLHALTWKRAAIAIAVLSVADRATFATFDLLRDYEIARAARVVPGYQRFTVRRLASRWFGWEPGRADLAIGGRSKSSSLDYPRKKLEFEKPAKPTNVIWVVLESWRHDAFDEKHAPELWEIGKKSRVYANHLSGGNNTTFGVFSMFYGLYGSYRSAFLSEHRGPVMIDRMRELDYRFAIYSSFPMTWPEFRKYTFVDIADSVKDVWPESESAKNDPLVIDAMLSFIDDPAQKDKPFFGFVQLDSSHAPYTFPEEFGKYEPYTRDAKLVRYIDVTQRAPEMRNRYFNAVLWESHEVGRLWKELETRGLLDSTAIVITGDHGEEFNEHGFWTHSGGYTPEQIHVPMILWWPGAEPATISARTTHLDLAPTVLEGALGVKSPAAHYSQGRSLLAPGERDPYAVSCGWRDCAVVDDLGYVVFGLESHYAMNFDVLDTDYKELPDPSEAMTARGDRMIEVMQRMGAFLK